MATDTLLDERTDEGIEENEETILTSDVAEGSALGIVGGAIVGGMAGGPIGLIVGAVVGGIASAYGVSAVEQHDVQEDKATADNFVAEPAVEATSFNPVIAEPATVVADAPIEPIVSIPPKVIAEPINEVSLHAQAVVLVPTIDTTMVPDEGFPDNDGVRWNMIRLRAYELYELRGREDGLALQDWFEAEREYTKA